MSPENKKVVLNIPEDLYRVLESFTHLFRFVTEDNSSSIEDTINTAITKGLDVMLFDVVGKDKSILLDSYKAMLYDNPEYIVRFIIKSIEMGDKEFNTSMIENDWKRKPTYL